MRAVCMALFVLLFCSVVFQLPMAFAGTAGYYVRVVAAYDEEFACKSIFEYGYTPDVLIAIIFTSAQGRFDTQLCIKLVIVSYKGWDSYDSPATYAEMLNEAASEVGFSSTRGVTDILIAFTGQDIPGGLYGCADWTRGTTLVKLTYKLAIGQATDNIVQHEVTHLYGPIYDEWENLDCVMNAGPFTYIGFPYYYWEQTALVSETWCGDCKSLIVARRGMWGVAYSTGGGGGGGSGSFLR